MVHERKRGRFGPLRNRGIWVALLMTAAIGLMTGVCLANPIHVPGPVDYAVKIYKKMLPVFGGLVVLWALLFLCRNKHFRMRDRFIILLYLVVGYLTCGLLFGFGFLIIAIIRMVRLFNGNPPTKARDDDLPPSPEI
ncbi:MAG: hypothetical protein J5845_09495 [Lachnospiraceae bacterium]|nr:hypothetical protein [Lachnospiraceae bacterium]MBO4651946.1 hypothetical protein [Lachnospiraceae bacterium]